MRRRAARPSTVFQLNQMAGKRKITPAAKRRWNQRECSRGDGFGGVPTFSTMVVTSIRPVPTREEFNCEYCGTCQGSDLQYISIAGDHLIQHGVNEEAEEQPRNQTGDDYDRKRLLTVGADGGDPHCNPRGFAVAPSSQFKGTSPFICQLSIVLSFRDQI